LLGAGALFAPLLLGLVVIREDQVGVVIKKFSSRSLPPGQFIALEGEAGYQADTLPPGLRFGYFFWQYKSRNAASSKSHRVRSPSSSPPPGVPIPAERILGRVVACDNFQDARQFCATAAKKAGNLA